MVTVEDQESVDPEMMWQVVDVLQVKEALEPLDGHGRLLELHVSGPELLVLLPELGEGLLVGREVGEDVAEPLEGH